MSNLIAILISQLGKFFILSRLTKKIAFKLVSWQSYENQFSSRLTTRPMLLGGRINRQLNSVPFSLQNDFVEP